MTAAALLIYWTMYQLKLGEKFGVGLDAKTKVQSNIVNTIVTKLLITCQQVMPQNRWVQQCIIVASMSALFSNQLWSHDDADCVQRMRTILAEAGGAPFPEVRGARAPGRRGDTAPCDRPEVALELGAPVACVRLVTAT